MKLPKKSGLQILLFSRLILFAFFQFLFFVLFRLLGKINAWQESQYWWPLSALMTNLVSIYLLVLLFRREGKTYLENFRFKKTNWKNDLLIFVGLFILTGPIAMLPNFLLSSMLWETAEIPVEMMFGPLPLWAIILSFAFPLTIAFAELPTYFGYIMPRLEISLKNSRWAMILPALFLALQHITLPLIFDPTFILYRFLMFLPFALFIGICIKIRPQLLPYFMIAHALMDIGTVAMFFM